LRQGFGGPAALRPLGFFQDECYFRTMIYLVASGLPFNLRNPLLQSPIQTHIEAKLVAETVAG